MEGVAAAGLGAGDDMAAVLPSNIMNRRNPGPHSYCQVEIPVFDQAVADEEVVGFVSAEGGSS